MNKNYLDEIAETYHLQSNIEDKFIEDISQEYFCDWVRETFSKSLRCCEMGFGDGITAKNLHAYFDDYSVIEGSSKLVKRAVDEIPSLKIECDLFEEYEPKNKFDLVLALHVLEHVDSPAQILKVIKGWLNPGGTVLILVPNKKSLHRIFALGMGLINNLETLSARDYQVGHQRVYDFESLEVDLLASEFKILFKKGFFLKPLPNSMMTTFDPKLIIELNKASSLVNDEYLANICVLATL